MRKILTILLTFLTVLLFGQDIKPIDPNFKPLQSPSFSYQIGKRVWIYKGATYGWTELAGWKGVKDEDDKDIPFTRENAIQLFTNLPELFDMIFPYAKDFKNFKVDLEELGNS